MSINYCNQEIRLFTYNVYEQLALTNTQQYTEEISYAMRIGR
jgi:hypothetical protein